MDNPLHSDTLEILTSSRYPMTADDIRQELCMWRIKNGEGVRVVTETQVLEALLDLFSRGKVDKADGSWRLKRVVEKQELQMELFGEQKP